MRNGYPITTIKVEEREEYMTALEKASIDNDLRDFIQIMARAVERSVDIYLYVAD